VHVPAIQSRRLDLVSMSPEFMRASLEGRLRQAAELIGASLPTDWPGSAARPMRRRIEQLSRDPTEQPWLLRAIVLRETPGRLVVGYINFHSRPDPDGAVEIGYTIAAEHRRRGYAREAVEALLGWAGREHGIRRFRASVAPSNEPSLGLLKSLGFVRTGRQWDAEDGEELVFERRDRM
jgi:RimJ/RimL family protein N-acetyltransferase